MANSVYQVNKGINKPIEFKGLKAQYIWYFGGGVIALLIVFAILYIIGVNAFVCIAVVLAAGSLLVVKLYAMSNSYGEHGMMKKLARRSVPRHIRCRSRAIFRNLKRQDHG